ncbi:MAG TPA: spore coat protein [Candidatus Gallacutalibacter stercoravium]|nr:spore coat protein [Candidatus Gallacutalibacter stercoravium]
MQLTQKELLAIADQLNAEKLLVARCKAYAQMAEDPQIQSMCELLAGKHQAHYQNLLGFLQE